ncbi:TonB-dependent receptor [Hydrogenobacter thermophilus TK-6]|uniref:TonB-dependent receptor n=1 Tax=Hydrogenobacter thermophilus (strain DSM 6534 / IAM 12695 / TK-6) TaxID=608538 RepID=D3DJJ4_HYDTT|nr:TonB-dependent receptor [Hydrogenobacter thermophilus]ADO45919.1 TonB-dependent receptor [Hydrogenobacter thermophilus TK-6]BAI69996.1 TonB-dependent receptor [Hydrogenobacter thermophilus TK-6]
MRGLSKGILFLISLVLTSFAQEKERELEPIEVIGISPLHGVDVSKERFPSSVETETYKEIEKQRTVNLSDFLNLRFSSIHLSTDRSNPFQNTLMYRGFTSSWMIGQPQGLSVYLDGVRMNEPFGDVVNWDIIPDKAINSVNLIPGSNPIFGLNTLGGSLSIETKNAFSFSGSEVGAYVGSFERRSGWFQTSYKLRENLGLYLTGDWFKGKGWRDFSDTDIKRGLGKLSYLLDRGFLDFSIIAADNSIQSTDVLLEKFLGIDRKMAFTARDIYKNNTYIFTHRGSYELSDHINLDWNLYYKKSRFSFDSGDMTDFEVEDSILVTEDEQPVLDKRGNPIPFPEGLIPGVVNRTVIKQNVYGGTIQTTLKGGIRGIKNSLTIGAGVDVSDAKYIFDREVGAFKPNREVSGFGILLGSAGDEVFFRDVKNRNAVYSLYFLDILSPFKPLDLFLGGRFNHIRVKLEDRTGLFPDINGTNSYSRFNPAVGASYEVLHNTFVYASYFESSRAPTPVEITCSDPNEPCRLPSAFVQDPPLRQVVAKTHETGIKGIMAGNIYWYLSLFNTDLKDDILPVAGGSLGQIYFKNVSKTRRRGLELGLEGKMGKLEVFAGYTLLDAEFRTQELFSSPNHPLIREVCNSGGSNPRVNCDLRALVVNPGDKIPGIPKHSIKLGMSYELLKGLSVGTDILYTSGVYLLGDEANLDRKTNSYTLVNLTANYRLGNLTLFARVENVFDKKYETTGRYVSLEDAAKLNPFLPVPVDPQRDSSRALAPGMPRSFLVGFNYSF